jgi:hypothetical protein
MNIEPIEAAYVYICFNFPLLIMSVWRLYEYVFEMLCVLNWKCIRGNKYDIYLKKTRGNFWNFESLTLNICLLFTVFIKL